MEGRLADALGLRARRLRASRHGPRDARLVVHRRSRAGREGLRDAAAGLVRLRVRGLRRRAEDVVVRGWRPHRRGRPARAGGADPPVALRPSQPQADLRHRLRPRGRPALRRVGLPGPQGRRPRQARPPGPRLGAGVGHGHRPAAGAAGRRTVPPALLGRRRHRRLGRADQPDRRRGVDDLSPGSTARWRGPASTSTRPTARPCASPPTRPPSRRWTTGSAPGWACCSTGSTSRCSSAPSRRSSTACPSWRAGWPSTTSRPTR